MPTQPRGHLRPRETYCRAVECVSRREWYVRDSSFVDEAAGRGKRSPRVVHHDHEIDRVSALALGNTFLLFRSFVRSFDRSCVGHNDDTVRHVARSAFAKQGGIASQSSPDPLGSTLRMPTAVNGRDELSSRGIRRHGKQPNFVGRSVALTRNEVVDTLARAHQRRRIDDKIMYIFCSRTSTRHLAIEIGCAEGSTTTTQRIKHDVLWGIGGDEQSTSERSSSDDRGLAWKTTHIERYSRINIFAYSLA